LVGLSCIEVDAAFVLSETSHCAPVALLPPQLDKLTFKYLLLPTLALVIIRFAKMFEHIQNTTKIQSWAPGDVDIRVVMWPHKKKSIAVRSDDLGGQEIGPRTAVQQSL
jgi:hypothetical protein